MFTNYYALQETVGKCFIADSLNGLRQHAEQDLEETQKVIQEYIAAVKEQASKIAATTFRKEVRLERREGRYSWDKGIRYDVSLHCIPETPDFIEFSFNYPVTERGEFSGRRRGSALKYAESLAAEHSCPLVKVGFPKEE